MIQPESRSQPPGLWHRQIQHFSGLGILLFLCYQFWHSLGKMHPNAYWIAVGLPVTHQIFVWLSWRLELSHRLVSRTIGFRIYLAIFFVLLIGRPLTLGWLAYLDRGTLSISLLFNFLVCTSLLIPWLYLVFSLKKYFGFVRAAGADHFVPKYRQLDLVRSGIFRFTSNGMYIFGFFVFWAIALAFASSSALVVAAFSHAYIWLHFYCTEQPDMAYLYK